MRRLVVLALLLGLMALLQTLQVGSDATLNPLSLATFGFVLLAAYTLGQVTAGAGLPKITGYIVTGLVFGPQVFNVFSGAVAEDLRVVNDLAIGLIALGAGAEMQLANLRKIAKSLAAIIVIKGLLILAAVTGAVWALSGFIPFLAGQPTGLVLSVGMILGVLAIGTSPAATIAVISETGAKGRLADTTLGVAVGKDIVMVVLLALAIALVGTFSPGGHGFETEILTDLVKELGLSLLAGVVLGVVIIAYMRYVGAELWLFLVAVVFAMTAVAHQLHLEALLTFIVGGFVVQNASTRGHDFVHLVETVALPVFVVFFSAAGAGIDLTALQAVGLVAVALVVVRLVAIWLGTKVATGLAGEPEEIRKNAWLAFVAQAGVVIGLVIIVEQRLPGIGTEIRALVMGMVAIHLLLGPVLFKLALGRAGEIAQDRVAGPEAEEVPAGWDVPAPELAPLAEELSWAVDGLSDQMRSALDELAVAAEKGPVRVAAAIAAGGVEDPDARTMLAAKWDDDLDAALQGFLDEAERLSLGAPKQLRVQLEEHWYRPARLDLGSERWRKRIRRVRRGIRRAVGAEPALHREVALRDLFLYHVKHAFTEDLQKPLSTLAAQPALTLRDAFGYSPPGNDELESDEEDGAAAGAFHHSQPASELLHLAWETRLRALKKDLALAGTAELPAGRRRPSRLRDRSTRARERMREASSVWRDLALSVVEHQERRDRIEALREELSGALVSFEPEFRERFAEDVEQPLRRARAVLEQALARLRDLESGNWSDLEDGLMQTGEWVSSELRREALAGLRRDLESHPFERTLRGLERRFDQLVDDLPEVYRVADPAALPDPARSPRSYPKPAEYEFRLITRSLVERIVGSSFERAEEQASSALTEAERVVRTTREELELRFEAALDSAMDERRDATGPRKGAPAGRPRALEVAEAALAGSIEELDAAINAAAKTGEDVGQALRSDVDSLVEGLGVRLAGARPLGARIQAERARVELKGPTILRLLGSRMRKRWNAILARLGYVRESSRSAGDGDAAGKFVPLGPAGPAGSDRALLFRIMFETTTNAGRVFDFLLIVAILVSIGVVMLDSVESVSTSFGGTLTLWEWFFTLLFTAEYVGRLYAVDRPTRYALSFFGVIDLLAVLPTYLSLLVPGGQYLVSIRILRVLRVFRVFKLARYVGEAKILGDALRASRYKITVFLVTVLTVTVVIGSVMFLVEGPEAGFTSIPAGVYWGIVTLTTVGFGDITPITPLGKTLAAMLMILGYAIIAVPTGILSAEMVRGPGTSGADASCPTCSSIEDDPEARFCRVCGTSLGR